MKEKELWKKLKYGLRLDMMERVENKVGVGWPDIYFLHGKKSGWIELKSEKDFPARIDFEPAQPNWHHDYAAIGGRSYIFLHVVNEKTIYVWEGKHARELYQAGGTSKIRTIIKCLDDQEGLDYLFIKLFM